MISYHHQQCLTHYVPHLWWSSSREDAKNACTGICVVGFVDHVIRLREISRGKKRRAGRGRGIAEPRQYVLRSRRRRRDASSPALPRGARTRTFCTHESLQHLVAGCIHRYSGGKALLAAWLQLLGRVSYFFQINTLEESEDLLLLLCLSRFCQLIIYTVHSFWYIFFLTILTNWNILVRVAADSNAWSITPKHLSIFFRLFFFSIAKCAHTGALGFPGSSYQWQDERFVLFGTFTFISTAPSKSPWFSSGPYCIRFFATVQLKLRTEKAGGAYSYIKGNINLPTIYSWLARLYA